MARGSNPRLVTPPSIVLGASVWMEGPSVKKLRSDHACCRLFMLNIVDRVQDKRLTTLAPSVVPSVGPVL